MALWKMKKKARVLIKRNIKDFCYRFVGQIQQAIWTLNEVKIVTENSLPRIFHAKDISFECVYSIDKNHVLIRFVNDAKGTFDFTTVIGDVFNCFDKTQSWATSGVAFKICNSSNINIKRCKIQGMKPFELDGDNIEIVIEELELVPPHQNMIVLEYAIVMSYSVFIKRLTTLNYFVNDILLSYLDFREKFGKKYDATDTDAEKYKDDLMEIKKNMEQLFFDEAIAELKIDEFLQSHPIVLKQCLNLEKLMHQTVLKDILGKYGQDLKPDLIGYDIAEKQWTIVDYKRAKRNIIKNTGDVRTAFKAEVTDLEAQLRDYTEYFAESEHRKYVHENYSANIEYPLGVGIIGNVSEEENRDFNRLKRDKPNWLKILPYNYIYDRFCRYIDAVKIIQ